PDAFGHRLFFVWLGLETLFSTPPGHWAVSIYAFPFSSNGIGILGFRLSIQELASEFTETWHTSSSSTSPRPCVGTSRGRFRRRGAPSRRPIRRRRRCARSGPARLMPR